MRRLTIAGGMALALLVASHLCWVTVERTRLAEQIGRVQARAERILLQDYPETPAKRRTQARLLYRDAYRAIQPIESVWQTTVGLVNAWSMHVDEHALFRDDLLRALPAWETTLCLIRSATRIEPENAYPDEAATADYRAMAASNHAFLVLGELVSAAAVHHILEGDRFEGLALVLDGLRMADHAASQATVVGLATAATLEVSTSYAVEVLVARLRSDERALAERLLAAVTNEAVWSRGLLDMLEFERMARIDEALYFSRASPALRRARGGGGGQAAFTRGLITPLILADRRLELVQELNPLVRAHRATPDAFSPAAIVLQRPKQRGLGAFYDATRAATRWSSPGTVLVIHYRSIAYRRMATLAVAIRLFEFDTGTRPAVLSELVPDYLERLPIDPFSPAKATFGYLPAGPAARIYTVDVDGIDHRGTRDPNTGGDLLFHLDAGADSADD